MAWGPYLGMIYWYLLRYWLIPNHKANQECAKGIINCRCNGGITLDRFGKCMFDKCGASCSGNYKFMLVSVGVLCNIFFLLLFQ